jgi:hypothetical protein
MLDTVKQSCTLALVIKKLKTKTRGWRSTVEDEKLVQELKAKLGVKNDSDLVRMGLRKLAQSEGLR